MPKMTPASNRRGTTRYQIALSKDNKCEREQMKHLSHIPPQSGKEMVGAGKHHVRDTHLTYQGVDPIVRL